VTVELHSAGGESCYRQEQTEMAERSGDTQALRCDFCGKGPNEVVKLIAGVNVDFEGHR